MQSQEWERHCVSRPFGVILACAHCLTEADMTPSIRKFLAAALLMFIGGVFCIAQQAAGSCSTYFVMYQFDQKLGLILFPALTVDQAKWLEKKGRKKYPSYCVDVDKATYVMVTF